MNHSVQYILNAQMHNINSRKFEPLALADQLPLRWL